jgi:hypothetical protein
LGIGPSVTTKPSPDKISPVHLDFTRGTNLMRRVVAGED